jgi:putative aldouronate transport system substrate-binding protein
MITQEPLSTGSVTKFTWAIPITAREPEAAMKFLNLMYTNKEIENLFAWGIEGRDYALNDQGEVYKLETNVYNSNDFLWGNQFLAYPAAGQGSDFRAAAEAEMKSAPRSKYFGCAVNTDPIANTLTAVYNAIQQYKAGYESGSVPVADTYEEYLQSDFVKALKAAGVDEVIAYYQGQLDAWLAAN